MNSKLAHIYIFASENLKLNLLSIKAPDESPNTDGIHISESKNVTVTNSVIGTGDDCISVLSGSRNILVFNVSCGPGHGISVGSLGRSYGDKDVSKLIVRNVTFAGTKNGVRIKSWPSSPVTTSASYFIFEDIVMKDVQNPIIIDQKYCPHNICDPRSPSRVKISHVKFRNIRGTTTTAVAVNLLCSDAVPCTNVELSDIHLRYTGRQPATATTSCINVRGFSNGNTKPRSCI
ncbi:hypothetical protein J5N97_004195 [Dioscorea zingiberensis]|uniref:Polygalacturonase n=1 Tax=Dioscorea zingiberensis TaxID=325984 RepID=A0A9D5D7F2_9LILI|nr:hypothetical protein J5N97_004195 [Dioscorea zingiberensis]